MVTFKSNIATQRDLYDDNTDGDASNAAFLTSNAISHVISVGHDPPTRLELRIPDPNSLTGKTDELQYHRLRLVDSASAASPEECVKQAAEILEQCRASSLQCNTHHIY